MRSVMAIADLTEAASWTDIVIHNFLPSFALTAGLLAAIWLACAVIATAGAYLGMLVFEGARRLIRAGLREVRRRWKPEYAHLVTLDSEGVNAVSVGPRRAHRWHPRTTASDTPQDGEP
jgi:hypothetical protein